MINEKFRVDIGSDFDYEDLIADIYFEDKILAILSQEHGFDNLIIEIYPPANEKSWSFRYVDFEEVINYAKDRLYKLRKIEE